MPIARRISFTLKALVIAALPLAPAWAQVTNSNDSGPGSFRAEAANLPSTIDFNIGAPAEITLTSGPVTLGQGNVYLDIGTHPVTISGDALILDFPDDVFRPRVWTNSSVANTLTIHSNITGTATLMVNDADGNITLVLTGTNTFSRTGNPTQQSNYGLRISEGNTVEVNSDAALGSGTVYLHDSTLRVAGATTIDNLFLLVDTATIETTANATISARLSGDGSLVKTGANTLTLSSTTNAYDGTTHVAAGTLRVSGGSAIPDTSALTIDSGATFDVNGSTESIGSLAGAGSVDINAGTLTVNQTSNTTLSGSITGSSGTFIKQGSGTLTLDGTVPFSGAITVGAGTLVVDASTVMNAVITVKNGATLELLGSVDNTVILEAGATLDGTGTVDGNLVLKGGATVSGGLSITGNTVEPPQITSASTASGSYRSVFTAYSVTADNAPTAFSVTAGSLPAGLTLNTGTGVVSGTPMAAGTFDVTIEASNDAGADTLDLEITIAKATVTPVLAAANKTADGTTSATVTTCSLNGSLGGNVQLVCGTATFADALVGDGKLVTVTGLSLAGADAAHYMLSSATATTTANILAAEPEPAPEPEPGPIRVDAGQILDGGKIDGVIENRGTIVNIELNPGAEIHGGIIGGTITGTPGNPAFIDAFVRAGTSLQHVRLGPNAVLHPGVRVGIGVCFMSAASIPRDLPLDGLMPRAEGTDVLQLSAPVLCDAAPFIATLGGIAGNIVQDAEGRLVLQVPAGRVALWPVAVFQGDRGTPAGYAVDEDGNLRLVADGGIVVVAWPALQDEATFAAGLTTLQLTPRRDDANGNFVLDPSNGSSADVTHRFSGRPHFVALPLADDIEPGLYFVLQQGTQLPLATVVFRNDDTLLAQYVVPVPNDWESLRANLLDQSGTNSVRIDAHGIIHAVIAGNDVRGMMDYRIERGATPLSERLEWRDMGDINGDGIADLLVIHANGDRQVLYRLP